jgi:hypothetical protein
VTEIRKAANTATEGSEELRQREETGSPHCDKEKGSPHCDIEKRKATRTATKKRRAASITMGDKRRQPALRHTEETGANGGTT